MRLINIIVLAAAILSAAPGARAAARAVAPFHPVAKMQIIVADDAPALSFPPASMKVPENDCGLQPDSTADGAIDPAATVGPGTDQQVPQVVPNATDGRDANKQAPGGAGPKNAQTAPGAPQAAPASPDHPRVVQKRPQPKGKPEVERTCAKGQVQVKLDAVFFGHRIGDKIPVTMTLIGHGRVAFDIASLEIVPNQSAFEMAVLPVSHVAQTRDGTEVRVDFWVQSFDEHPTLKLQMALRYANVFAPDESPIWQDLASSEFLFLKSNTTFLGSVDGLMMTGMSPARPRYSWAIVPGYVSGLSLVLGAVLFAFLKAINRIRPRQAASPAVTAWLKLDELVRSGNKIGFTSKHYEGISTAIKRYLFAAYPQLQAQTAEAVKVQLTDDPKRDAIAGALTKLRQVVYLEEDLTPSEHSRLVQELRIIVPRPWSV